MASSILLPRKDSSTSINHFGAMASDVLDGYLARRYKATSRFGSMLDPLTDKFFVFVCVAILYWERSLSPEHLLLIFARDIFLVLFAIYLSVVGGWRDTITELSFWEDFHSSSIYYFTWGHRRCADSCNQLAPLIVLGFLYFLERVIDYRKQCIH